MPPILRTPSFFISFLLRFDGFYTCFLSWLYVQLLFGRNKFRYLRNTLFSLRNSWNTWRKALMPVQVSLHPSLPCQTWNVLSTLNLLASRRGQRGGNHLRLDTNAIFLMVVILQAVFHRLEIHHTS